MWGVQHYCMVGDNLLWTWLHAAPHTDCTGHCPAMHFLAHSAFLPDLDWEASFYDRMMSLGNNAFLVARPQVQFYKVEHLKRSPARTPSYRTEMLFRLWQMRLCLSRVFFVPFVALLLTLKVTYRPAQASTLLYSGYMFARSKTTKMLIRLDVI